MMQERTLRSKINNWGSGVRHTGKIPGYRSLLQCPTRLLPHQPPGSLRPRSLALFLIAHACILLCGQHSLKQSPRCCSTRGSMLCLPGELAQVTACSSDPWHLPVNTELAPCGTKGHGQGRRPCRDRRQPPACPWPPTLPHPPRSRLQALDAL